MRVDREEWLAETVDGSRLPVGAKVVVLGVQGTRLQVRDLGTARLDEALK
ncbi:MAG: NfeD family protein [Caldilineaceae bacterium]